MKIDRHNAKAMIRGFLKDGQVHRQSIWVTAKDVKEGTFPALLTCQTSCRFPLSDIGREMSAKNYVMPLKYAVELDSEYFIRNEMTLWEIICMNGLFDIWKPVAPFNVFKNKRDFSKFRIQLLRIFEIDHEFTSGNIMHPNKYIDKLKSITMHEVEKKAPVISDEEFDILKKLLERSVAPYLICPPRQGASLTVEASSIIDTTVREDIDSFNYENEYLEGEKTSRLSSFYERNPRLRAAAVRYHGTKCTICNFDFEQVYGTRGQGFIEVHHLNPVSKFIEPSPVDPITEMTVVCPNCHRMIHRKKDLVLKPDQLREIIKHRNDELQTS